MRVEPMPISLRTSPERMLDDAMAHVDVKGYPGNLLPALDSILAKYPDYLDGYLRRLDVVCDGSDQAAILSNINNALKYVDRSQSGKGTLAARV
jgi:hypothetical protein